MDATALKRRKKYSFSMPMAAFLILSVVSNGQEFNEPELIYFENRVESIVASFEMVTARPHFLGEETGRKYSVFHDLYSMVVGGDAMYSGPQIVIDKPAIYRAVQRANRYYRKQWRRSRISDLEAYEKVNHMLNVAISVYTQPTEALEEEFRSAGSAEKIANIFERIVLL